MGRRAPLILQVRSSYPDGKLTLEANRRRLGISQATVIPSLMQQTTQDYEIRLRIHQTDPLRSERLAAWESLPVKIDWQTGFTDFPSGKLRLVGRLDDDDAVHPEYYSDMIAKAARCRPGTCLDYPAGALYIRGNIGRYSNFGNMFNAVLVDDGRHAFTVMHNKVASAYRVVSVASRPRWCWVRHDQNMSKHIRSYVTKRATHPNEFGIDISALRSWTEKDKSGI